MATSRMHETRDLTAPPGQPIPALEDHVDVDHRRLDQLLDELERMPTTPGVVGRLVRVLEREVEAHLVAIEDVVLAEADGLAVDHDGGADAEELRRTVTQLRHALFDAPPFELLRAQLERHRRHEVDELLPALRQRVGDRRMVELGERYGSRRDQGFGF
jgi:hypothetical protein